MRIRQSTLKVRVTLLWSETKRRLVTDDHNTIPFADRRTGIWLDGPEQCHRHASIVAVVHKKYVVELMGKEVKVEVEFVTSFV